MQTNVILKIVDNIAYLGGYPYTGKYKIFFENKRIHKVMSYLQGKLNGSYLVYNEDGKLIEKNIFISNSLILNNKYDTEKVGKITEEDNSIDITKEGVITK
jgi:antitoxin component YwqK of YwqJK toxin-antitoxin module